jgi:hypothetical protein
MMKRYRKMKRRHQVHLDSMGMKRDTARRHGDVDRRRGEREETTTVGQM